MDSSIVELTHKERSVIMGGSALTLPADRNAYLRAGFFLRLNRDGSVMIIPTSVPPEASSAPSIGQPFRPAEHLFLQCALNIGLWGPAGSLVIDPTEGGLVWSPPTPEAKTATMTLHPNGRVLRAWGGWCIDLFYWLDEASTTPRPRELHEIFDVKEKGRSLLIGRRLKHKVAQYQRAYTATIDDDGCVTIALKKGLWNGVLGGLRRLPWGLPSGVSVSIGKLQWTGIEIKMGKPE